MLRRRRDIAVLATAYALHEAQRCCEIHYLKRMAIGQENLSPWSAALGLRTLVRHDLLKLGKGEGDRREVLITPEGQAWFANHAEYLRQGNIYRYEVVKGPTRFSGPLGRRFWGKLQNKYFALKYSRLMGY